MEPVRVVLLGAGSRGRCAYGNVAKANPDMLRIVAVAEPDGEKGRILAAKHGIPRGRVFASWEEALDDAPEAEAVIIASPDRLHKGPVLKAMEKGLHILCEKPLAPTLEDCREIEKAAASYGKVFMAAHVLKYSPFFGRIKALLEEGRIGRLVGINLVEHVGHIHMSHSFVRGNWRNAAQSSPMILAKSCHDLDMLYWLSGAARCESLSSYGELRYFKAENAPPGAPARCLDGCPQGLTCPWNARKIYLGPYTGWPVDVISTDLSLEARRKALEEGPYGRCVFRCDNDVVDHQQVSMRFDNGVQAAFTMTGFTMDIHRSIDLFGTAAEITGDMEAGVITVREFSSRDTEVITLGPPVGGHGGGDTAFAADFVRMVRGEGGLGLNAASQALESHYMAFAAEASRLAGGALVKPRAW